MVEHAKRLFYLLLLVGSACRPEPAGKVALNTPPDTTMLTQLTDSANFLGQDGLNYEPLNTGTFNQLPPEISNILNAKHPGWTLPYISEEQLAKTERNHTGPYYLQADFDQDNTQDFAVQYLLKDTIFVQAYLQKPGNNLQEYPLDKYPFKQLATKEESKLYLSLLSQGQEITTGTNHKIKLPKNAVAVLYSPNSFLYYLNGNNFTKQNWLAPLAN